MASRTNTPLGRAVERKHTLRLLALLALPALLMVLASCGGSDDEGPKGPEAGGYRPASVENCGRRTNYRKPPKRAVGMTQATTELMLALGLRERIVGTAFQDSQPLPRYKREYQSIRKIADQFPSREALVGASPDFAIGGLDNFAFSKPEGRDRDSLQSRGINTYAFQCATDKGSKLEILNRRVAELGRIFGVEDRSTALVKRISGSLGRTKKDVAGTRKAKVFIYDSGKDQPMTFPGGALASELIETAGGTNVARKVPGAFGPVSWEQVAAGDPDVIVVTDFSTGPSVKAKRKQLLSVDAIAKTRAIRERRIATVPFVDLVPSIRIGDGANRLARALHPDRF